MMMKGLLEQLILILLSIIFAFDHVHALSLEPQQQFNRRDAALMIGSTAVATCTSASATTPAAETVDLEAFNAVRAATKSKSSNVAAETVDIDAFKAARAKTSSGPVAASIIPMTDPPSFLAIRGSDKKAVKIPRVGYSLYKTAPEQAARGTSLALRGGVVHFDLATMYGSNGEVAKSLRKYLDVGMPGLNFSDESPELLERLDTVASLTGVDPNILAPPPLGSIGRRGRRNELFLSYKLSNAEQSTDPVAVRRSVLSAIQTLGCSYLDLVSLHSPLTDKARRLTTYETLLDLRDSGFIRAVGVCNYGLGPLQEIYDARGGTLELPAMNQLELSPFNSHSNVVDWCNQNGISVGCSAWSRLSGENGPKEQWDVVANLAQSKGVTKAQILVRWSLQKGYVCVPRSGTGSKIERIAIAENSYGGVKSFVLTEEEMKILDNLDVGYKAGKLGRTDGWDANDITGVEWDPTDFV